MEKFKEMAIIMGTNVKKKQFETMAAIMSLAGMAEQKSKHQDNDGNYILSRGPDISALEDMERFVYNSNPRPYKSGDYTPQKYKAMKKGHEKRKQAEKNNRRMAKARKKK